jgi:hypothetical protein
MKLRFPQTRYRVVRDRWAGYEAQFRPWWSLFWMQCSRYHGGPGTNTHETIESARQLCADHAKHPYHRVGQVVAQFSARQLDANQ